MQQAVDGFSVSVLFKQQYTSSKTAVKFKGKHEVLLADASQIISSKDWKMYAVCLHNLSSIDIFEHIFIINIVDSEQRHCHDRPCDIQLRVAARRESTLAQ